MKKYILFILFFFLILSYESYTHIKQPQLSLTNYTQGLLLGEGNSPQYSPGKNIWLILGWIGSILMCLSLLYSVRKRVAYFKKWGNLKSWLDAHIFLGILGPMMIVFHSTFKIGGLIAISFWTMVSVVLSGFIGRYIYAQIPRGIKGNTLSLNEIEKENRELSEQIQAFFSVNYRYEDFFSSLNLYRTEKEFTPFPALLFMIKNDFQNIFKILSFKKKIKEEFSLSADEEKKVSNLLNKKARLIRRIHFLSVSRQLLDYWHLFHKPFCIILFIVMFLHTIVYYLFRI